jgi:hypothetical protein
MNLCLLQQREDPGYDRVHAGVVAAFIPWDARECIKQQDKDLDWSNKGCVLKKIGHYTGPRAKPHVILLDVHEG